MFAEIALLSLISHSVSVMHLSCLQARMFPEIFRLIEQVLKESPGVAAENRLILGNCSMGKELMKRTAVASPIGPISH